MTAIVGIKCRDGIVIGSDSSATFGPHPNIKTIEQPCKKVEVISNQVILTGTGSVGLHQRFREIVTKYWADKKYRLPGGTVSKTQFDIAKELSALAIQDFVSTMADKGQYGALLAFPAGGSLHLCEFQVADFQPEFKEGQIWFVSMGSGQTITDPFLGLMRRVFWPNDLPSLSEGTFVATWTLDHVIRLNTGGINAPSQIAILDSKMNASLLDNDKISEHTTLVQGAEAHMAQFRSVLSGAGATPIPDPAPKTK